jgi:PIN domain nuclease of toxin-antitoxin system
MRLLLDTCAAIWVFEGSDRIPSVIRDAIVDPGNEVLFSDVSMLEIEIKHSVGKFPLNAPPSRSVYPLIEKHGLEVLHLTALDILTLETLPMHHRDPFDRLLVAQAMVNRASLVSPDPLLRRYEADIFW